MLTVADARSFLFTASQIIPTLLVALYVLDRRIALPGEAEVEDLVRRSEELEKELDELEARRREKALNLLSISFGMHWLQRSLVEADFGRDPNLIASLKETTRRYSSLSLNFAEETDRFLASRKTLSQQVKRLARIRKRMLNTQIQYRLQFVFVTVSATVAEGAALLGGIGVIKMYIATMLTLIAIGLALLVLIEFAFARFFYSGSDGAKWESVVALCFRTVLLAAYIFYLAIALTFRVK